MICEEGCTVDQYKTGAENISLSAEVITACRGWCQGEWCKRGLEVKKCKGYIGEQW